jgi:hypothetical protein
VCMIGKPTELGLGVYWQRAQEKGSLAIGAMEEHLYTMFLSPDAVSRWFDMNFCVSLCSVVVLSLGRYKLIVLGVSKP